MQLREREGEIKIEKNEIERQEWRVFRESDCVSKLLSLHPRRGREPVAGSGGVFKIERQE